RFPDDPAWRSLELTATDYQHAEQAFQEAARLRPGDSSLPARASFCSGRAAMLAGDTQRAEQKFQEAIDQDRSLPEPHNALGVIRLESSRYDDAVSEFQTARQAAPRWAFPHHNLALAYIEKGDFRAALQEYESALVD